MEFIYNTETEKWEERKEPFITIEVETEEDFDFIQSAIEHYKKCNSHGWISVKDRLPEIGKEVLIYSEYGVDVSEYVGGDFGEVTHWMQLPEPPERMGGGEK